MKGSYWSWSRVEVVKNDQFGKNKIRTLVSKSLVFKSTFNRSLLNVTRTRSTLFSIYVPVLNLLSPETKDSDTKVFFHL